MMPSYFFAKKRYFVSRFCVICITVSPTRGFEPRAFLQKTQKQAQSLLLCFLAEDMGLEPTGRCRLT